MTTEPRIPQPIKEERIDEILDILNGFIVHEYEVGTELVDGRAVPVSEVVGTDFNIDAAIAWAVEQDEVEEYATGFSVLHGPCITLVGGEVIAWTGSLWEFEAQARP